MKIKKLTQIVIATLLTSSAYAETLTFHGQEQALAEFTDERSNPINFLQKRVRVTLYNPNNFSVKIRLNAHQRETSLDIAGNFAVASGTPEIITINAQSGYIYNPSSSGTFSPDADNNNTDDTGGKMCDLDMYQSITRTDDTFLNCASVATIITVSWQDSLLRNSDSSIKTVAPITGVLSYFYQRAPTNPPIPGEF